MPSLAADWDHIKGLMWFQHGVALTIIFLCGILGSMLPLWLKHANSVSEALRAHLLALGESPLFLD